MAGLFGLLLSFPAAAHINPDLHKGRDKDQQAGYREDCTTAQAQIDQDINNVRARLTTGGDVWWDRNDGKYVVPQVEPGQPEVSSIFAGAVWLGGFDPAGNLKLAAQTYGNNNGSSDFWPGPLDPETGTTDLAICNDWDRFFEVFASEIDEHRALFEASEEGGAAYSSDLIPRGVKGWPGKGNPFFFDINGFDLPNTDQGLAGFFDANGDDLYNPLDGDFPIIEIRGCDNEDNPQYPDQMIFWIYNDAGGIHAESNGDPIQMEVQVQAFSYVSNDEINDMTFQRYKLINRAIEDIDSTYFAMWVDADLGCFTDDYVGGDTTRSLAYTYNADAVDGTNGTDCGAVPTYGVNVPIIGVDYFRGPLKPVFVGNDPIARDTVELGMSSFVYYNNGGIGEPPPPTTDPDFAIEYYRYLSGSWRDGSPFTFGGNGLGGTQPTSYVFPDAPNVNGGWSMCEETLPEYDRRTVQASGPFRLKPGATNELIVGAVWVPDVNYPCPALNKLLAADDLAQGLFDACFDIPEGPDAPDVDWIELDREVIAVLTNDPDESNNFNLGYTERDLLVGPGTPDSNYVFEGYRLYQLVGPTVSTADLDNPDLAKLVEQVDVVNGVREIYNWSTVTGPGDEEIFVPEIQVQGTDNGIRNTFQITQDLFGQGDTRLVNHRKYYFTVIAYGYNNFQQFDTEDGSGQRRPYLEGRRNIKVYTVIPRPILYQELNASYGDAPQVTRLDGKGSGDNFLDVVPEDREAMLRDDFDGEITYREGESPVDVRIFNPLEVVNGEYELFIKDDDMSDEVLDASTAFWELRNTESGEVYTSQGTIAAKSEEILGDLGISITIGQVEQLGQVTDKDVNGSLGFELEYEEEDAEPWFAGVAENPAGLVNYTTEDNPADPEGALANMAPGIVPYQLAKFRATGEEGGLIAQFGFLSPSFISSQNALGVSPEDFLPRLNNVDIVFTDDKSQWSRCFVIETANGFYEAAGAETEGGASNFEVRAARSVTREDSDNDGNPDIDGSESRDGFGWFPGYAVDVETGQRLNIFFGENSTYNGEDFRAPDDAFLDSNPTGGDMAFNPTSQIFLNTETGTVDIYNFIYGAQHYFYVTDTPYDGCEQLYADLNGGLLQRRDALRHLTWLGFPVLNDGTTFKSYADGLIPDDLTLKLRVATQYAVEVADEDGNGSIDADEYEAPATGTGVNKFYPAYRFSFDGVEAEEAVGVEVENALDSINVVPNPYYAFSQYESTQFDNLVKITNLPLEATITIYSLDGKFIRQYQRNEELQRPDGAARAIRFAQDVPDLEWDLKNAKGIPVASGVYLIHVNAPGYGERTIKWFGVNRKFDPSGL